ncbi:glycoside hydrolase [Gautieria morchelliformis]|nr:glycoside hydrolase [Gautieria morchelliformis]
MNHLAKSQSTEHGVWPTISDVTSGTPTSAQYTVGAYSGSAYEYLLKQYLLSCKTEHRLASGDIFGNIFPGRKFEHLSCFFPGLQMIYHTFKQQRELHMWAAEGLADTCWVMFADRPSGLGPEIVVFDSWARTGTEASAQPSQPAEDWKRETGGNVFGLHTVDKTTARPPVGNAGKPLGFDEEAGPLDYSISTLPYHQSCGLHVALSLEDAKSPLDPGTIKGARWPERVWEIWEAIESQTRTEGVYASVYGVDALRPSYYDSMPGHVLFKWSLPGG